MLSRLGYDLSYHSLQHCRLVEGSRGRGLALYYDRMSHFVTLSCPSCGARLTIEEDSARYRCDYCGNEHVAKGGDKAGEPIRPRIPVPSVVKIEKDGQSARIIQRWFSLKYIPMAFFCLAWDSFLIFWYSMAFRENVPWIFIVFPVAHLAVGIGLTYATLCGFLNRTVLEVTRDELAIWHEPLPWLGEKSIPVVDLKQLYCKEKVTRSDGSTAHQYKLFAVTQNGREVELVGNLDSPDVALFFEQQIETWLRIPDRAVVGEFK